MTPKEVLEMAKAKGAVMLDLKFMDFPGMWQHFSVPISELEESTFEDGYALTDRPSVAGSPSTLRTCWSSPIPARP